jgi:excisionase family DNA binding protein
MTMLKVKNAEGSYEALDTKPLWTVEDVATYLRLQQETVRMMARKNKLPALKVGKAWRFRSDEIKSMTNTTTGNMLK